MTRFAPIVALVAIAGVALWSVPMAFGLTVVAAGALFVRQSSAPRGSEVRAADRDRTARALALGASELDDEATEPALTSDAIHVDSPFGVADIRVSWHESYPVIEATVPIGHAAEMAFVIRRKNSPLDLAPVVENTPLPGAPVDLRLRRMPLGDGLDDRFEAATSRPRLFRELLDLGLRDALHDVGDQSRFRVEDIVLTGEALVLTLQPAADPAEAPWLAEVMQLASWLTTGVSRFLSSAAVPSALG